MLNTGDVVNFDELLGEPTTLEWAFWFATTTPLLSQSPMFCVRGNHDDGTNLFSLTFTGDPILSDLRSGTIITISEDLPSDVSYDPAQGDWWINLRAGFSGDGLYISASSFDVSNRDTQITLFDVSFEVVFGPAGEGIKPGSGIGTDEVFKLEEDPGPSITPLSNT